MCCFSTKYATLRSKSKEWLVWNQNNVTEWSGLSTGGLLASTIKVQQSMLASYKVDIIIIISSNVTCSHHDMYMLSGCELIDTENISLPSQNMKFVGE